MKHSQPYVLLILLLFACSSNQQPGADFRFDDGDSSEEAATVKASAYVDLQNKGVGSITEVVLGEGIDTTLVTQGEAIYQEKCTLCHKPTEEFIGPAPKGILERRTPEWVMNMILNPGKMIKEDSLAQALFMEYNGSPMANQQLTESDARAVLEYFRTL